jgi:predicted acetyltransferase
MCVKIRSAKTGDKSHVRGQLQDCLEELRAFATVEQAYAYFDDYWNASTRWPYVVEGSGKSIGFILINQWSPSGLGTDYAVAEFYIAPRSRGRGYGKEAACQVFQKHRGQWELAIFNGNTRAQAFWPAAIIKSGAASFDRIARADSTILRFVIPA